MATQEVAKSNDYNETAVEVVEVTGQSMEDLNVFKDFYENKATVEEKKDINDRFKTYLDEELQKDEELKNKLNGSEIVESSEISEQDIANLDTVRNLTDVLNKYPNITSPEYRAVKRVIDEYVKNLTDETQKILSNPEKAE